ncbi:MAG TPA: NAD-dependent epimerase/dehydratase family protein [Bacteroidota bacterium]|nr:NAD-dependent epimerase/dehydratase family protein [Bacteroidota bacterium]
MAGSHPDLCLVLGGCGFLGSVVTRRLVEKGHAVRVLDKEGQNTDRIKSVLPQIELQFGDFSSAGDLAVALDGVRTVIHFVGTTIPQTSMNDIEFDVETNVLPTVRLLEQLKDRRSVRLIFSSSGGTVYGAAKPDTPLSENDPTEPISAYGISKLMIEKYIRLFSVNYALPAVIMRFSNPYGPSQHPLRPQGAVGVFVNRALRGEEIVVWGDGSTVRDYLYEDDLATAVLSVVEKPARDGIYNVGSGTGTSITDLVRSIERTFGVRCKIRYDSSRRFDVPYNVLRIDKLTSETGWRPEYTLLKGLEALKASLDPRH